MLILTGAVQRKFINNKTEKNGNGLIINKKIRCFAKELVTDSAAQIVRSLNKIILDASNKYNIKELKRC